MVERTQLATGLEISRILTGLWQVADMERGGSSMSQEEGALEMRRYVDAGLTTFDMADHYGTSELIAGQYEAGWPESAELLTKWVPKPGSVAREEARAAVELALERMGREQLDLLQFHAWSYADPGWLDCIFCLQELKEEGLIRHLGVTNTDSTHLAMLLNSGVDIASNQVCYSLLDQRAGGAMTELCLQHDIKLLAFGTLAGGFLTEHWVGVPEPDFQSLETWSQMKYKRFINAAGGWDKFQALLKALERVARRLEVSVANVASRAILDAPSVAGVIIGARLGKREHIEDNLRLFDFELDRPALDEIEHARSEFLQIPGGCGDEYRKPPFLTAAGDLSDHFDKFPSPYPTRIIQEGRTIALSGTKWENIAGFARAVRQGDRILVSGTTATHRDRLIGGSDPASQTHFCIDKIEGALQSLGGRLEDVVRSRIYIADPEIWEPVARAHGERFRHIQPTNTLVSVGLIGDGYLVEMEAEALVLEAPD
ncbi:MAG TPA: aldo/keto reductase [Gemmatimonadetes bacterium]|jgi:aryl-alcohol dehydrogenase-like predicted oxidoreductase/enamine deaminase RidA (YjgF/YER057c/UK114 family)|nr:aldo/keto reductase [Gemmatimonadota bacterium]HIC15843.1 aldo/keto reductase [Gemmatimonadota bacterium]HIN77226.1 aldo/keto reductase [Gemmatimonadota bacterium]